MKGTLGSKQGSAVGGVLWESDLTGLVEEHYEWLWLYAAVEPTTGTGVFLLLPSVSGECLELFLHHLRKELGNGPVGVVLDSSGSHPSRAVRLAC